MRKYNSIFATEEHKVITSVRELKKRWDGGKLGFFLNGKVIGYGYLYKSPNHGVHTSGTQILEKYRKQGHGIELYKALIETARSIGATHIRSDVSLNKFSRRMWRDKLSKLYDVRKRMSYRPCSHCGRGGPNFRYFYINFK